jgi:hypothetical protein
MKLNKTLPTKTGLRAGQSDVIILNGTTTCPWTTKQREYFDSNGIPYEFKDCDKGECRDGIVGYPTLDNVVGYHEL